MKDNSNEKPMGSEESYWRVKAQTASHLDCWIEEYFDGLSAEHQSDGSTNIRGSLPDLPAFYGFILKLRDAGVDVISLQAYRVMY